MNNQQKSWGGKPTDNLIALTGANAEIERSGTSYPYFSADITSLVQSRWSVSNNKFSVSFEGRRDYSVGGTGGGGDGYPSFYIYFTDWSWAYSFGTGSYTWEYVKGENIEMPNPSGKGVYFSIYHMNAGNPGKSYSRKHQMEFGTVSTPFVNGTRYANSNLESSPSYPSWNTNGGSSYSGGTLTFVASNSYDTHNWDFYKTYSGLSTGTNYTWSALVKLGTASNLIITMNNTQAWNTGPSTVVAGLSSTDWTRVSITGTTNTGSFNLHLGSSANSEVYSRPQSGGTVFIQDVRLVLSQSQTAVSDMMNQSTISPNSLTYNSDGTFDFTYSNPSYLTIPLASAFNKTEGTMNFWVYPTRYNGGNGYFVNREDASANAVDWFWIGPYSGTFYFRIGDGSTCCNNDLAFGSVSSVIPLNTWTNMCFTWKINGTSAIYKNGILYTSRSIGNIPTTNPANNGRIGLGHSNADDYFNGKMSQVQIYNRQLTDLEVFQNFNSLRGRYGL